MSEFERRGRECGQQSASDNRKAIQKCGTNIAVSKLAAEKMDFWIKLSTDWWCNEPEWRIGFWDAFMTRAEDFKKEKQ